MNLLKYLLSYLIYLSIIPGRANERSQILNNHSSHRCERLQKERAGSPLPELRKQGPRSGGCGWGSSLNGPEGSMGSEAVADGSVRIRCTWVWILPLPFTSCVTLRYLLTTPSLNVLICKNCIHKASEHSFIHSENTPWASIPGPVLGTGDAAANRTDKVVMRIK